MRKEVNIMANMVSHVNYGKNQKQILIGQDSYFISLPVKLSGTAGAKMFAGQPLSGDIKNRDAAFTAGTEAVGVLLHDVVFDADGNANGTIVLAGCIDLLKLEESIQTAIQGATGLDRIIFVKGSAY
jgi:hypothetical protein